MPISNGSCLDVFLQKVADLHRKHLHHRTAAPRLCSVPGLIWVHAGSVSAAEREHLMSSARQRGRTRVGRQQQTTARPCFLLRFTHSTSIFFWMEPWTNKPLNMYDFIKTLEQFSTSRINLSSSMARDLCLLL